VAGLPCACTLFLEDGEDGDERLATLAAESERGNGWLSYLPDHGPERSCTSHAWGKKQEIKKKKRSFSQVSHRILGGFQVREQHTNKRTVGDLACCTAAASPSSAESAAPGGNRACESGLRKAKTKTLNTSAARMWRQRQRITGKWFQPSQQRLDH
jgi:hypothetical protein